MTKIYKHNFSLRLQDLSKTINFVLEDFTKKYDLTVNCKYRVETADGKCFDGFFRHLKVSAFRNNLDVWCCFYKVKKDGTKSKNDTGVHMSKIVDITLYPF
ncbi:hypothetical protein [Dysgonomonas sp. Marseille-P4361]|uniref:hypothetical protein n=1 Tax=Dysgonomonas sp. Marseille-P4361 TaxID=2161820 RepID=UPI000D55BDB3|nr:hypothetical protein [Dysgonomonas sp. Marseille-P4361]